MGPGCKHYYGRFWVSSKPQKLKDAVKLTPAL
jgi:hypothetical protein